MRWLLPSIADWVFIAILGVLVFTNLSVRLLGDAGIGWHIRTGQWILSTQAVPHFDPFSSSLSGRPWFAWEWLYDVLVGWLDWGAGLNGVVFFTAAVIAATFSGVFRLILRRKTSLPIALALTLLAASASTIHFLARPHVVSWFFSLVWVWVLDGFEHAGSESPGEFRRHRRLLLLLPLLMLIWVNVHGGFLVGFVLLGIYWLNAVWRWFRLKEDSFDDFLEKVRAGKRARDLAWIAFLSALATFVNPYGWKLHVHIFRYLSNRFLMDHIDEFQSPNFHGVAEKCFAVLLLLTLVALAADRRGVAKRRLSEMLLLLFAAYSGLYAARNIPVSSLLLIWVIGPKLSGAIVTAVGSFAKKGPMARSQGVESEPFLRRMQILDSGLHGHLWPVAAAAVICWVAFHSTALGGKSLMNAHFDRKRFPVAAVDYLAKRRAEGPLFAPDYWGGYLIYRLYPGTKVVIDDRHDFYGEPFLRSYLKTIHVEPGWEEFLDQHPAAYLVVPKTSALASILLETPRWQPIYSDDVTTVFSGSNNHP